MMKTLRRKLMAVLLLSSVASLLCFGILGVGRVGESSFDGAYLYAAGRSWLEGRNPYNHNDLIQSVAGLNGIPINDYFLKDFFAYPPQSAALCITLALLSYPSAKIALLLLNLLSIVAIVAMTVYTINRHAKKNDNKVGSGLMAAYIIGNPFTTHVVWMGQSSLIAFAVTMAAWVLNRQRKWVLAGICLGLASFKPQICALLVVWFLLEQNWKTLSVALVTVVVMSIYPMRVQGSIGMIKAWYEGFQGYKSVTLNAVDSQNDVVGLEKLLHVAGFNSLPNLAILGLVLVVILWIVRNKINIEDVFGILMAMTVTFVYAHNYDYVCLVPIFTSLWLYFNDYRKVWPSIISLIFMLFVPQRLIRFLGVPILEQWRTVVILILLIVLVVLSIKHKFTTKQRLQEMTP